MSIKAKLSWLLIFWSLLILLISNTVIYYSFMKLSEERERESVQKIGEAIVRQAQTNDLFSPAGRSFLNSLLPDDGMIRLFDPHHQLVYSMVEEDDLAELPPPANETARRSEISQVDDEMVAIFSAPLYRDHTRIGMIELVKNLDEQLDDIDMLLTILIVVSTILIVAAVFLGRITSGLFLRPVSMIGQAMDKIRKTGGFQKIHIVKRTNDEMYELAHNFNQMVDHLEEMFDKQEKFISDASHELKTPLTVIESYASMLRRWGKDRPELVAEGIDVIEDEAKRLRQLVEQLLDVASIPHKPFELEEINIVEVSRQIANRLEVSMNRRIVVETEADVMMALASREKLVQVLIILVDNAIKYSDKDIFMKIGNRIGSPIIQIIDQGIGIPKEEIPHLFERFYRVDKARTRSTGGAGLGLSIAHLIMKQSQGRIVVESEVGAGTTVTIFLKQSR